MATMKAIRIHEFGGLEQMKVEVIERPMARAGEMLVRVDAGSVNPVDYKTGEGKFPSVGADKLPITPGRDVCGAVIEVGAGVRGFIPGDLVYAMLGVNHGGYAEYALVAASEAARKPQGISVTDASAVPLAALTAWQGLFDHGQLRAGQTVLIHGGAGGVGHFAVQFARAAGAFVSTTVSRDQVAFARDLGAENAIDYKSQWPTDGSFDLVLDLIGGETQERSWSLLKQGGTLISTVQEPAKDRAAAIGGRAERFMCTPNAVQLAEIATLIDAGKVRVHIDKVFWLSEARQALGI